MIDLKDFKSAEFKDFKHLEDTLTRFLEDKTETMTVPQAIVCYDLVHVMPDRLSSLLTMDIGIENTLEEKKYSALMSGASSLFMHIKDSNIEECLGVIKEIDKDRLSDVIEGSFDGPKTNVMAGVMTFLKLICDTLDDLDEDEREAISEGVEGAFLLSTSMEKLKKLKKKHDEDKHSKERQELINKLKDLLGE